MKSKIGTRELPLFHRDKQIIFQTFHDDTIKVRKRWMWCEVDIIEMICKHCGDCNRITIHQRDINKLISALKKMKDKPRRKPKRT